ncbi:MAG: CDP-alcohol phosphatidyltransferase family protein [Bifidobacteriaceae bacterium]|jgi:phosphatidylserine synthase|nr:CDP-alcohol phosphatidyltransferase family protein [Bifidobacteriaceae bacterium]
MLGGAHPANVVTYLGVAAAVAGLGLAEAGQVALALVCLAAAGIADLFDGAVARRFKRTRLQRLLGVALDSLADAVSFLALPAAVLFATGSQPWAWAVAAVYVIAGLTRLAWFDAEAYARATASTGEPGTGDAHRAEPPGGTPALGRAGEPDGPDGAGERPAADRAGEPGGPLAPGQSGDREQPITHYRGLPVTYAALLLPLVGLAALAFAPELLGPGLAIGLVALAFLFVWDVPVPKPRGAWYAVFALVFLGVTAGLLVVR